MGIVVGIVILGLIFWTSYARYVRVLARKRYSSRQYEEPDLSRFAGESPSATPPADGPAG